MFMKLIHLLAAAGAEEGAAENFVNAVTHVSKAQIGNGIHLRLRHIHFKKVFHKFSPRFSRNWAQKPVNKPVIMLQMIIIGR